MSSRRPTSPLLSASSSRNPSIASQAANQHAPTTPSGLREAHTSARSPEDREGTPNMSMDVAPSSSEPSPTTSPTHLNTDPGAEHVALDGKTHGFSDLGSKAVTETTALLRRPFDFLVSSPHEGPCNHGTFSPRVDSGAESIRSEQSGLAFGGSPPGGRRSRSGEGSQNIFGSFLETVGMKDGSSRKKKMSTTSYLAERHGITNTTTMYATKFAIFLY